MPCFFDIPAAKNSSTIHFVDASMSFLTLCGSFFVIHGSLTQESYGSSKSQFQLAGKMDRRMNETNVSAAITNTKPISCPCIRGKTSGK